MILKKKTRPAPWTLMRPKKHVRSHRDRSAYKLNRKRFIHENPMCRRCSGKTDDVHHSRGRAGTLLLDERFWLPVCRECHDWIHANIQKAREGGFICERGLWNKS